MSYIDYQLKSVGACEKLFDEEVKNAVFDFTHGIPRQINNACNACLLQAALQKSKKVTTAVFNQAMAELQVL